MTVVIVVCILFFVFVVGDAQKQMNSALFGTLFITNTRQNFRTGPGHNVNSIHSNQIDGCYTGILRIGDNELKVTSRAKGICDNCCLPRQSRDLHFVVYGKKNRDNGTEIVPQLKAGAARAAGVDSRWPTVIFIHGFTETSPGGSGRAIVDAYLSRPEDYNIILFDWSELSALPWYWEAFRNVQLVASTLAKFIEIYNDSGEIPISKLHLIGFSLGAHVAGHVGKTLRKGLRLPRITGLDPAYPEFSLKYISKRLCESDAEYVDVIHTDSGILGIPVSIGHSDFYPNGGRALQPGCQQSYFLEFDKMFACSHVRAWQYYAESVTNPMAFPATKCKMWRGPNKMCDFSRDAYMGFTANVTNAKGTYYLMTKAGHPFSRSVEEQTA